MRAALLFPQELSPVLPPRSTSHLDRRNFSTGAVEEALSFLQANAAVLQPRSVSRGIIGTFVAAGIVVSINNFSCSAASFDLKFGSEEL